jgi:hypothetical protein
LRKCLRVRRHQSDPQEAATKETKVWTCDLTVISLVYRVMGRPVVEKS